MAIQNYNNNTPMELLKKNLERQNEQGQAMVKLINHVEEIEGNMNEKYEQMGIMLQDVKDSVTLTYEEQMQLQSIVFTNSIEIAKKYFGDEEVSDDEFKKQVGAFRRGTWKQLKQKMNVPRYSAIRRVDFDEATKFVDSLRLKDFMNL